MPQDTDLAYVDSPGALPATYTYPGGLDVNLQSIVARIDGSGAAGSFKPCIDILNANGTLIARVPSDVTYAPGDTGVVSWTPFLTRRVTSTPVSSGGGFFAGVYFPVLELAMEANNLAAGIGVINYVIDNTYPHNGYVEQTTDQNYIAWPVELGPQGSIWLPIALFDKGPDRGKYELQLAGAEPDTATGVPTGPSNIAAGDWKTHANLTYDGYAVGANPYPGSPQIFSAFRINGADGAKGTAFSAGFYGLDWDGGSGGYGIRVKTNGKNAASTGFRRRLSGLVLLRLGDDSLA